MDDRFPNPHAGLPFDDDLPAIEAHLAGVSVPALLCSLVHMTGDPSWIRGDARPVSSSLMDFQSAMPAEVQEDVRRRAAPVIAAYRDAGAGPVPLGRELVDEMMAFVACGPVAEDAGAMFHEDLQLSGADARAVSWKDEIPAEVRADSPVVVIGCGESGIAAGIRLAQAGLPFTIVEKGSGPGGTWRENRYPGARVDVASHHYCYSFEPGDHWSEWFCRQPELEAYFTDVVDKYELRSHCRFDTEVIAATWDEATARWRVEVRDADGAVEVLDARFVISAVGALSLPRYPDFLGMADFAGPSFHTARWPEDLDLAGTRFALIGAGATGFQIAPTIAPDVEQLTIFQRTAQWMIPNPMYHEPVPEGDRWAMRHLPFYGRWFRFLMMWPGIGSGPEVFREDPTYEGEGDIPVINGASAFMREWLVEWISSNLEGRPDLIEKSIPDYPPAGKRMLQDNGSWLKCLSRPNVEFVRTAIERIVPEGVVTADGTLHEADVLCFATGFRHVQYLSPIRFTGRGGVDLHEQWGEEPKAYLGITVPGFPNLFSLYGPGTNLAHGVSIIFHSECQVNYALSAIHTALAADATAIEVRQDVSDEYAERYQREISQFVWAHPTIEHSHYKNAEGKIWTLSPWPIPQYWRWTGAVDPEDYVLT